LLSNQKAEHDGCIMCSPAYAQRWQHGLAHHQLLVVFHINAIVLSSRAKEGGERRRNPIACLARFDDGGGAVDKNPMMPHNDGAERGRGNIASRATKKLYISIHGVVP
jgi:hypothetical protein